MHAFRLFREIIEHVSAPTQFHSDSLRLQYTTFMGRFLLARVGKPITLTAGK
jgi:predicted membrane GTPase involved in stress response